MEQARSRTKTRYLRRLSQIAQLSPDERERLQPVVGRYVFRANDYYLGLIDWDDPDDPIRKIVIPREEELREFGRLDASDEASNYTVPHLQHKYTNTALLMVSEICGGYCRFCFRKRLFMDRVSEAGFDIGEGLAYIRDHPEIDNVLLTGGDPLMIGPRKLDRMFEEIFSIPHVKVIRLGTKIPAFDPRRVVHSRTLLASVRRHSRGEQQIYFMVHFNHPRELSDEAAGALDAIRRAGGQMAAQTPLLGGINDDPALLRELFNRLSYLGAAPYYLFQGRPVVGNDSFRVDLERGFALVEEAKVGMSGLARRLRYAMSHAEGKLEILGVTKDRVMLKFHQARDPRNLGKAFLLPRVPGAGWLDDLLEHPLARAELLRQGIRAAPTGLTWERWTGRAWPGDADARERPGLSP